MPVLSEEFLNWRKRSIPFFQIELWSKRTKIKPSLKKFENRLHNCHIWLSYYLILLRKWTCFKSNLLILWHKGGRGESVCYAKKSYFLYSIPWIKMCSPSHFPMQPLNCSARSAVKSFMGRVVQKNKEDLERKLRYDPVTLDRLNKHKPNKKPKRKEMSLREKKSRGIYKISPKNQRWTAPFIDFKREYLC